MKSTSEHLRVSGAMSNVNNKDEDEDELEALRLAALESLRVKGLPPPIPVVPSGPPPILSVPPPQPVLPSNHVFKRHQGNLIAIIPIEQSTSVPPPLFTNAPLSVVNTAMLPDLRRPPPRTNHVTRHNRPPLLKDPPRGKPVLDQPPTVAEEKPKVPTKFSRFEDSDSEEEDDDIDLSLAKSDNEEEEIVVEAADADDIVIEIFDEEVAEEEDVDEIVLEEPDEELSVELGESVQPELEPKIKTDSSPDVKDESRIKSNNTVHERLSIRRRSSSPTRKTDSPKDWKSFRDHKSEVTNRLADDMNNRSPKHDKRSPNSRRRSPNRSQRSPIRSKRSPVRRSPPRSQRSPPPRTRSPVARSHRSPVRALKSPSRTHRSPVRSHKSPPRSPLRSRSPHQRSQRSPSRTQANRSPQPKHSDREKAKLESKPLSVVERLGSMDSRRASEQSKTHRPSSGEGSQRDQKREKSPINDRKILLRNTPPKRSGSSEKEPQKAPASLSDVDRLELRKRKFETPLHLDAKKDGKIRLRTETSSPHPPEDKSKRSQTVPVKIRKESPPVEKPKSDERTLKNGKRSSKKSKEEKHQNRSRVEPEEEAPLTVKLAGAKSRDSSSDHSDLRAELQRRRNNRHEDDEPRSRTPETRRILVLNSPTIAPSSVVQLAPSKSAVEPKGVLSKQKRCLDKRKKSGSSDSLTVERNDKVTTKRTLLTSSIEMDKGRETDPLEDRIRHIRAQNELIRKRQLEIEADKLQYA